MSSVIAQFTIVVLRLLSEIVCHMRQMDSCFYLTRRALRQKDRKGLETCKPTFEILCRQYDRAQVVILYQAAYLRRDFLPFPAHHKELAHGSVDELANPR